MLEVRGVSKRFGGVAAVDDVSLRVLRGQTVGVIGPNGAGKTTLFNCLSGTARPDQGEIVFETSGIFPDHRALSRERGGVLCHTPLIGLDPHFITQLGMARTFQNIRLFSDLSVLDNVFIGAHSRMRSGFLDALLQSDFASREEEEIREQAMKLLSFVGISERAQEVASALPFGLQRRLEIARALASKPTLLLLDEPAAGLNPSEKMDLLALIRKLKEQGLTILLIEHDMGVVMPVCDRIAVLDYGKKIADGKPAAIQKDVDVIEAYLGVVSSSTSRSGFRVPGSGEDPLTKKVLGSSPELRALNPERAVAKCNSPMLKLDQVKAGYGPGDVLHGISLEVQAGEIVALLGANGAGKTTTLLSISGLVAAREGSIMFEGQSIVGQEASEIVRQGIGHVPEGRRILPRMSVLENLELGAYIRNDGSQVRKDIAHAFNLFPILKQRAHQLAGTLSGGEQQMLAIARGLMSRPRLLLLDEPSLGLAPKLVQSIFEILRRIRDEGLTLLLVEQNAYMALQTADRGYVLEAGRVVLSDTANRLMEDDRVKSAYLGG